SPSRTACLQPDVWVRSFSDFGEAVERVLMEAENPIPGVDDEECVTVEEVDRVLDNMGSRNKFSNEATRRKKFEEEVDEAIGAILRRLSSEQAKWLMRIVLKEDKVVELPGKRLVFGVIGEIKQFDSSIHTRSISFFIAAHLRRPA